MRERELRIALVSGGGVSLAVYMHGVTSEILKLIRASRALHAIADRGKRLAAEYPVETAPDGAECDTEPVYFELLRDIGRTVELRVILDIIAGASAGGINGTMLSRALAHDLAMEPLREGWLKDADVSVLLASEARAGTFSKVFVRPFLWIASKLGYFGMGSDPEVLGKISLFVRSRWFQPPLDGPAMAALMYDGILAMGTPRSPDASLLPSGQSLDLFVTLTDFHGHPQLIQIHDPPLIHELEHQQLLHFGYRRHSNGAVVSDFELTNAGGLAFAARATSSFPGAFPPACIAEMDALIARRRDEWPDRSVFIARNFQGHLNAGVDPVRASFLDGAILNNRPFRQAISAIRGRPAYRQVDRRLVYIDPDPAPPASAYRGTMPSFFTTIRGAVSDIPSSQPVANELNWIADYNDRVRRLRAIIDSARPHVSALVAGAVTTPIEGRVTEKELRLWREQVNNQVARDAGFAYEAYVRLKIDQAFVFIVEMIARLRGVPRRSPLKHVVAAVLQVWAARRNVTYHPAEAGALQNEAAGAAALPRWVEFLLAFDVGYRERRLRFLVEGQNRLYTLLDQADFAGSNPAELDRLKREFYVRLDRLNAVRESSFYSDKTTDLVAEVFPVVPSADEIKHVGAYATAFVDREVDKLDRLIERLAEEIGLDATTHDIDALLADLDPARWHASARREVFVNYLGFPFWDVLTFPVISNEGVGEFHEILVDRISPRDSRALNDADGAPTVKGAGFGHFAAFLSRAYRENDYLLGRLHALERLVDIVCDCANRSPGVTLIDLGKVKQRGFLRILDAEEPHLPHSAKLIATLRERFAK